MRLQVKVVEQPLEGVAWIQQQKQWWKCTKCGQEEQSKSCKYQMFPMKEFHAGVIIQELPNDSVIT